MKTLIVSFHTDFSHVDRTAWEAQGWKVELEPIVIPLDFTDNISHEDMAEFLDEIEGNQNA